MENVMVSLDIASGRSVYGQSRIHAGLEIGIGVLSRRLDPDNEHELVQALHHVVVWISKTGTFSWSIVLSISNVHLTR